MDMKNKLICVFSIEIKIEIDINSDELLKIIGKKRKKRKK
jgi:hypothetical protein